MERFLKGVFAGLVLAGLVLLGGPVFALEGPRSVIVGYWGPSDHLDVLEEPASPPPLGGSANQIATVKLTTGGEMVVVRDVKSVKEGHYLVTGDAAYGVRLVRRGEGSAQPGTPYLGALQLKNDLLRSSFASIGGPMPGDDRLAAQMVTAQVLGGNQVAWRLLNSVSGEVLFQAIYTGEVPFSTVAQVIALPNNRIAAAAHVGSGARAVVDVVSLHLVGERRWRKRWRVAGVRNVTDPVSTEELPDLKEVRDLRGFGPTAPDDLLIVTRERVFRYRIGGGLIWSLRVADLGIGGEFVSATVFADESVAVGVMQPGKGSLPDVNHRVAWVSKSGSFDGRISAPLSQAPQTIDAAKGEGGTGSAGYLGVDLPEVQVTKGEVQFAGLVLDKSVYLANERAAGVLTLNFQGGPDHPDRSEAVVHQIDFVAVARAVNEAPCIYREEGVRFTLVGPREKILLRGENQLPVDLGALPPDFIGPGCLFARLQNRSGDSVTYSQSSDGTLFEVVSKRGVPPRDELIFNPAAFEDDRGKVLNPVKPPVPPPSCHCSAASGPSDFGSPILIFFGMMWFRRRNGVKKRCQQ